MDEAIQWIGKSCKLQLAKPGLKKLRAWLKYRKARLIHARGIRPDDPEDTIVIDDEILPDVQPTDDDLHMTIHKIWSTTTESMNVRDMVQQLQEAFKVTFTIETCDKVLDYTRELSDESRSLAKAKASNKSKTAETTPGKTKQTTNAPKVSPEQATPPAQKVRFQTDSPPDNKSNTKTELKRSFAGVLNQPKAGKPVKKKPKERETTTWAKTNAAVKPSLQASTALRETLMASFTCMQEAEPSVLLMPLREGTLLPPIMNAKDIPKTTIKMKEYFSGIRVMIKGGTSYTNSRWAYNGEPELFLQTCDETLQGIGGRVFKSVIPVADIDENVWLHGAPMDANAAEWTETLLPIMEAEAKKDGCTAKMIMGLSDKRIYMGKNANDDDQNAYEKRIQRALFVAVPKNRDRVTTKYLKQALNSEEFKAKYRLQIHMVPKFNQQATLSKQRLVNTAIRRHLQIRRSLVSVEIPGFDDIDTIMTGTNIEGKTIRELLLKLKRPGTDDPLILSIDTKTWNGVAHMATYPKMYEDSSKEQIQLSPAVIYHTFGDDTLLFMSADGYDDALQTEWDEENGRPISWEETMANQAANDDGPAWLMEDKDGGKDLFRNINAPEAARPVRGSNLGNGDDNSHKTFGLGDREVPEDTETVTEPVADQTRPPSSYTVETFQPPPDEDLTHNSSLAEERVAQLESSMSNMQSNVQMMLEMMKANAVSQATSHSSPGASDNGSAQDASPTGAQTPSASAETPAGGKV